LQTFVLRSIAFKSLILKHTVVYHRPTNDLMHTTLTARQVLVALQKGTLTNFN